jgi:hypothetical protein
MEAIGQGVLGDAFELSDLVDRLRVNAGPYPLVFDGEVPFLSLAMFRASAR